MIGDVLTSSILCENIKIHSVNAEVHYMVNSNTIPVILENPFIDKIINFKVEYRKSKKELLKLINELNKENYDAVIDVYGKIETNFICFLLKTKIKIAYYKWYSKHIYTHPIKRLNQPDLSINYTINNRLQLLHPILSKTVKQHNYIHFPKIYLRDDEILAAKSFLIENKVDNEKPIFMISILGSSLSKSYPFPYMAAVIDEIAKTDCTILFNYIPNQINDVNKIYELCSPKTQTKIVIDLFAPSLREFLAILSLCSAIIGNEGGAINMAKALNVPSFAIFSPWIDKKEWANNNSEKHYATHLEDYHPELFGEKKYKKYKKESEKLYNKFKPSFFKEKLDEFLKNVTY